MRKHWLYALYCFASKNLLPVDAFVQGVQHSFPRLVGDGTNYDYRRDAGGASVRPCFCSSPRVADVSVPPGATVVPPVSAAEVSPRASDKDDELFLPFRHSSKVYIEMTDMYGIVYYANYLTYARRAIEHAFGGPAARFHCIHAMKYRAAATLGETAIVDGSLVSCDTTHGRSRWRFKISAADPSRVFVSAEVTLSWPGEAGALPPGWRAPPGTAATLDNTLVESRVADPQLLHPLPEAFVDCPKTLEVVVWSDDLEGTGGEGGNLSVRALLNYFERIRTLSLGRGVDGELGLMRLHREGVSIVVSNISDLRLDSTGVVAGDKLEVRLGAKLTRGNRAMTMYETLWTEDNTLVAHAEVGLLCIDNETRKFRSVPPWVQEVLTVPSVVAAE